MRKLFIIFFVSINLLFAQDIEYSENVGNKYFDMNIDYKVVDKKVFLNIKTKNLQSDGKGGVSVTFPEFKTSSRILRNENQGFDSVKPYPSGSDLWNGKYKGTVKAQSLLVEGWSTSWKKDEEKSINLEIDIDKLVGLIINVRANLISNKEEFVFPESGMIGKQGYFSKQIYLQLKKEEKKAQKEEKFFYGKKELIEDSILTSYEILSDNQVKLDVTFAPFQNSNGGGISISFPELKDDKKIIKKSSKGFTDINVYKAESKLWNGNLKKSIKSDYLLVEGWSKEWNKLDYKTITLIVNAKDLDELKVNIRANFKYIDQFTEKKDEIIIPNEGLEDQQDYFVKQLIIPTKVEYFKAEIIPKINEVHMAESGNVINYNNYIITYSNNLKIWDRVSNKLIKTFDINIKNSRISNNKFFFITADTFGYVDLKDLFIKKLDTNLSSSTKMPLFAYDGKTANNVGNTNFSGIYYKNSKIIVPFSSSFSYNFLTYGYVSYDLKNENLDRNLFLPLYKSDWHDAKYEFSEKLDAIYINPGENSLAGDNWYKIDKNFKQEPFFFEDEKTLNNLRVKNIKLNVNDFLFSDLGNDFYSQDIIKNNNFFIPKREENKMLSVDQSKILFNDAFKIDVERSEDNFVRLFLINKKTNKKTKILERADIHGASFSCSFSEPIVYGDFLRINFDDEICPASTSYLVSKEGMFLTEMTSGLVNFGTNYFKIENAYIKLLNKDFQTIKKYKQYTSDVINVEIKDNKVIVSSSNNQIMYYDYETQELLYTEYKIDKDTQITVLKEGFIDGKGDFEKHLHFLDDKNKVYTINQFYDFFYRPDLVKLKLQGKDISQYTNGLTYQDALKNPPPKIDILKVEDQNVTVRKDQNEDVNLANDKTTLKFNVLNNNGGIGLIRVYQEGKLIKTFGDGEINKQAANVDTVVSQDNLNEKVKLAQNEYLEKMQNSVTRGINDLTPLDDSIGSVVTSNVNNNAGEYSIDLDLISGKNEISIEAFNSSNTVSSYKESINIISSVAKKDPTLYAIVTGVNEFESNYVSNLKYSQNDANAIKEAIEKEKGKSYKNVEIIYLIGKDLTKENLNNAIENIKQKAKLEDALVFYISTHGKNYKGKLMLVPQNNKSVKNLISFEELFKNMQTIKTLKQVFILDTCESGSANDIVSSIYDSKASVLAKSSGVHMLLATTKGTFAFEHPNPNIKHGVFTNNILNALEDKNSDKNRDKNISIIELSTMLKDPKYIVDQQYPIIRNVGNDIKVRDLK